MGSLSGFKRVLLGKPIKSAHAHHEKLPILIALPVFASDALSSVAYASEEIMHVFGHAGMPQFFAYTANISLAVAFLILCVALSYRQTIYAYPNGGGSYLVAKENLGVRAGMVAGASIVIDYILTVAVSTSAGVAAIISMNPNLGQYTIPLCLASIAVVTIANLRGAKESGALFAVPTYTFIVLLFILLIFGFMQPVQPVPAMIAEARENSKQLGTLAMVFLFAKAFSAGCTALTGVEAVANSTSAFRAPASRNATITLFIMAIILGTLFNGLSHLAERFHAIPMETGAEGFKTIVAQLAATTFGEKHWMFFAIQLATAAILFLAANTAYADFPRITGILARDGFMPRQFAALGDKLVHQNGIILLAVVASIVVIVSGGDVSKLVALYAIGVFVCFTLSQFGMVAHERRRNKPLKSYIISIIGGSITTFVALVIFISKFDKGSWIVLVAGGAIMFIFSRVFKHYSYLAKSLNIEPDDTLPVTKGTVLLLVPRVHKGILQAISYGQAMAKDIRAVHVTLDKSSAERIKQDWQRFGADIPLVILESPYRSLLQPILDYIDQTIEEDPHSIITVIVPQAVPKHWWQGILHNNAAVSLKLALGARRNVVITNVRYFLK